MTGLYQKKITPDNSEVILSSMRNAYSLISVFHQNPSGIFDGRAFFVVFIP